MTGKDFQAFLNSPYWGCLRSDTTVLEIDGEERTFEDEELHAEGDPFAKYESVRIISVTISDFDVSSGVWMTHSTLAEFYNEYLEKRDAYPSKV